MDKLKVMTIVGTRPEIIKLSQVMKELDRHVEHIIVHTGQNYDYELNELFFEQLEIRKPDIFLEAIKGTPSETIGDIIAKADKVFNKIKPEALLIYGDTNSCLSVIPAKKRKIGSIGKPLPTNEMNILNENGKKFKPNPPPGTIAFNFPDVFSVTFSHWSTTLAKNIPPPISILCENG